MTPGQIFTSENQYHEKQFCFFEWTHHFLKNKSNQIEIIHWNNNVLSQCGILKSTKTGSGLFISSTKAEYSVFSIHFFLDISDQHQTILRRGRMLLRHRLQNVFLLLPVQSVNFALIWLVLQKLPKLPVWGQLTRNLSTIVILWMISCSSVFPRWQRNLTAFLKLQWDSWTWTLHLKWLFL